MVIYSDGRAGFCCLDHEGIYNLGSFVDRSLTQIWNGPGYTALRDRMRAWDIGHLPKCRNCNFARLEPRKPHHWKRLLVFNTSDNPRYVHLEFNAEQGFVRSGNRLVQPYSLLPWGVLYRNDISEVSVIVSNAEPHRVAIQELHYIMMFVFSSDISVARGMLLARVGRPFAFVFSIFQLALDLHTKGSSWRFRTEAGQEMQRQSTNPSKSSGEARALWGYGNSETGKLLAIMSVYRYVEL